MRSFTPLQRIGDSWVEGRQEHHASRWKRAPFDIIREGFDLVIRGGDELEDTRLIARAHVEEDLSGGRLQSVLEGWSTVEISLYAVYPSRQHLVPKLRVFLDVLIRQFQQAG